MFQALTNPSFRLLWSASWLWYICRWMETVVAFWLVLSLTNSSSLVALVGVCRFTPMFLLGLVIGSLADRFSKKRMMVAAQTINLMVISSMAALNLSGAIQTWHVYIATLLTGTSWAIDFSARRSYYAETIGTDRLVNAVSLDMAVFNVGAMLGPILGGSLIAAAGFTGTYATMAGLYLMGFILLLSLKSQAGPTPNPNRESVAAQVVEAARVVKANSTLWAVLLVTAGLNFFGFPYTSVLPVIARDVLGANSVLYGFLAAAPGMGALIGALIIAQRGVRRRGTLYSLGAILMLVAVLLFSLSRIYPLSLALLLIAGLGQSGFAAMQTAITLAAAPPEMRGRAMGAIALGIGTSPLGIFLLGNVAESIGPAVAVTALSSSGLIVMTTLRWRFPALRDRAPRPA